MRLKINSAMSPEFHQAWKESGCDWSTYVGNCWLLYDGTLFVTRDESDDEANKAHDGRDRRYISLLRELQS